MIPRCFLICLLGSTCLLVGACSQSAEVDNPTKPPRPVSVIPLVSTRPQIHSEITGAVVAWKTEQIGFEVAGRIEFVTEPNEFIEGRLEGRDTVLADGTPLARLKDDRYQIAVQSAEAAVTVNQRQVDAIKIDIQQRIPANVAAAEANQKLAKIERDRIAKLYRDNAISKGELDQAETSLATTLAELGKARAEGATREAELLSAEASLLQSQQQLADAKRNLADCELFSSFRGQVARTHVIPGSYVNPGDPVVTVQMMDPLSIEFEVSAQDSRRFSPGDSFRVISTDPEEQKCDMTGHVYLVDAVADPQTRTFTVKLLVRNHQMDQELPAGYQPEDFIFTRDLWPLNIGPVLGGNHELFAEEHAIHRDQDGAFVWRIRNRKMDESSQSRAILEVEKVRVIADEVEVPFLGLWKFYPIRPVEQATFDADSDLIAGELVTASNHETDADQWNGHSMLLHQEDWLLRPGDLVRVSLVQSSANGWFVPMRMVRQESDDSFVFTTYRDGEKTYARRIPVRLFPEDTVYTDQGTYQRIEPVQEGQLSEQSELVSEGMHYLTDGDEIAVIPLPGVSQ